MSLGGGGRGLVADGFPGSRGTIPMEGVRLKYRTKLEIAQSEQDVSPFCKESDMTYS